MSLTDYSDLEKEIDDVPEAKILPRGSEVKARVIFVAEGEGDYGKWYRMTFDVPSEPSVIEFGDFFSDLIDAKEGEEKNYQKAIRKFKAFAAAFDLDYSKPFNWVDDLAGLEGWVILGVKKSDEYGDQNTVSKYVTGK